MSAKFTRKLKLARHKIISAKPPAYFFYFLFKGNWKSAVLIAALVLSHWLLDMLVHVPDLPLTPFTKIKAGLGLWNYKYLALLFELLLFAIGVYFYIQSTKPNNKKGSIGFLGIIHLSACYPGNECIWPATSGSTTGSHHGSVAVVTGAVGRMD